MPFYETIKRFAASGLLATAMATGVPFAALAQEACQPFTLTSLEGRIVVTVDLGTEGPSLEDRRVGERIIGDVDRNPVGEVRWEITLLDPDPQGAPTHNLLRMFFFLDNGTILAEGVHTPARHMHNTDKVSINRTELIVLGGTSAFRHAQGMIEMHPDADGDPEHLVYDVDITCE